MRNYSISVAMTTYNGEKYIKEQLDSVLKQLDINDEIVISDDGSTDNTLSIIKSYNDPRIKLITGPKNGVKQNFANAIKNCTGDYIFLSDQDDIWEDNKVKEVMKSFKDSITLVLHDCSIINQNNNLIVDSYFKYRKTKLGIVNNIIKNSYIGCCMAFKSNLKDYILPIPNNIEMHDQWIGILSEKYGKSILLNEKLIKYRRHKNNTSSMKHHGIIKMIKNRLILIKEIIKR